MKKSLITRALVVIGVILVSGYILVTNPINKGLDLQGGTHFTIETSLEKIPETQRDDAVEKTLAVFRNRIDDIGVAGTTIQKQGENRIIVQVPGVGTDETERIKNILLTQARLEFRLVDEGPGESGLIN